MCEQIYVASERAQNLNPTATLKPDPSPTKSTYTVVLKHPPAELDNPASRKNFLESKCGKSCSHIVDLKPRKNEWRVVIVAQALASALAREYKSSAVKVSSPSFYDIIRFIPEDVSADDLSTRIKNCTRAERIRSTRTYKLHFESKEHLNETGR